MSEIEILELAKYRITKVDYRILEETDEEATLYAEDSIVETKINKNTIEVVFKRHVFFEPSHLFSISVESTLIFNKNKEIANLKDIDKEDIIKEIETKVNPVPNRVSLIISTITAEALGLPLVTPPNFIKTRISL